MVIFMVNLNSWCASSWLLTSLQPLTLFGNPISLASPLFHSSWQLFKPLPFSLVLRFICFSLLSHRITLRSISQQKCKPWDWTLLQLWGGCIAQMLVALALDLNLEFIKVHFMVSIFSSLNQLCENQGKLLLYVCFLILKWGPQGC